MLDCEYVPADKELNLFDVVNVDVDINQKDKNKFVVRSSSP